jgi:hypothetical protein
MVNTEIVKLFVGLCPELNHYGLSTAQYPRAMVLRRTDAGA